MFDLGFWELLVIGAIALLVIGPERLPEVARTMGRWVGKVQRFVASVKSDVDRELRTDELRKMMDSQKSELDRLKARLDTSASDLNQDVTASGKSAPDGGSGDQYLVRNPDNAGSGADGSPATATSEKPTEGDTSTPDGKGG